MLSCLETVMSPPTHPYQDRLAYWGRLVRAARQQHGWRQVDLTNHLNATFPQERHVSRQTLDDFERGSGGSTNLTLPKLLALCALLDIDLSLLFVEPTTPLARLVVQLQAYPPATTERLLECFATLQNPLVRERQRPPD